MEKSMPIRALALFLVLTVLLSSCAQATPTGTWDAGNQTPEFPETATENLDLADTLPRATPTPEQEMPTTMPAAPETGETQSAIQLVLSPRFRLQTGSLVALANFVVPEAGCNWLGVGGQAFDLNGNPLTMLVVEVGGRLAGSDVFHLALTGSSTVLGPGGFVIPLADHAIDSSGELWIILYDLAGTALTSKIYFPTYADCTKNFILINFSERSATDEHQMLLPWIRR